MLFHSKAVFALARENMMLLVKLLAIFHSDSCNNKSYTIHLLFLTTNYSLVVGASCWPSFAFHFFISGVGTRKPVLPIIIYQKGPFTLPIEF